MPLRIARLRAELLVGGVAGAQQIAVHQQYRASVEHDHRRVGQDAHAGAARVGLAEQEIAVATEEEQRNAGVAQCAQLARDGGAGLGRIVVADPGFEQIAQHVQRARGARPFAQETHEQVGDRRAFGLQVEIGDEERGHRPIL